MLAPKEIWWKPLHRLEKNWVIIAFVWCIMLTAMMPLWFFNGKQNVPTTTYRVTSEEFMRRLDESIEMYQVGEERNVPIVAPPPGADVYLVGRQWNWYPILQLEAGETYNLHLSSTDVQHGFSLQPVNLNLQVLPGYDYVAKITPTSAGDFSVVCNEFCSTLHHTMTGKIIVTD